MADITGNISSPVRATGVISSAQFISGSIVGLRGLKGDKGDTGDTGNGIASAILNSDYTLTLTFTDGTSYTTPPIRGQQGEQGEQGTQGVQGEKGDKGDKGDTGATGATGNGISTAVLNSDYTLTLTFTDGTSYTTGSIRGAQGEQGIQGIQGIQGEQGETGPQGAKGDTGDKGEKGDKGDTGDRGYSPTATVSKVGNTATITITDQDGTTTAEVYDGMGAITDVTQNGTSVLDGSIAKVTVPTKTSDLTNDAGFITSYTETDPTVPNWAKQATKPSYTASEVGALPSTTVIPSKTSDLTNDSGFLTEETDPTVPSWAKQASKPSYTYSEVGAAAASHNHDSRYYTESEVDTLLADKADTSDIPTVPTNVSAFTNDAGYLTSYTETDPTVPNWAKAASKPSYNFSEIGSKPTTLSGYGITDAKIKSGVITLGSNTITPLTSHQSIKTINGTSLVGSGNIATMTKVSTTVTIAVADWSATTTCTKSVSGVTTSNDVIVTPAPASISDWQSGGVYCSAQGSGTLTFTCSTTPSSAITVNVLIIN